jgi:hypothetical protein
MKNVVYLAFPEPFIDEEKTDLSSSGNSRDELP